MKLLVVVTGFGPPHQKFKLSLFLHNIGILRKSWNGEINVKVFNYSDEKINITRLYDVNIEQILEKDIIGQYLYKYLNPDCVKDYDYIMLILDDIELDLNFNLDKLIKIYEKEEFNILSPCLSKDSQFNREFMLENDEKYGDKIRIVNFIEYFCYLMNIENYKVYYDLLDKNCFWLWGIDTCLDKYFSKLGIMNNMKIKHWIKRASYKEKLNDAWLELSYNQSRLGSIASFEDKDLITTNLD